MADNTIYDMLDEVNCADSCESVIAPSELIDELLKDIQHLELECISTRYLLSRHMDEEQGSLLRVTCWKIWDADIMTARHISCLKNFCITADIPWNSATILSKYNRWYKRIVRRGLESVRLEVFLVSIGQNLYKFHNKKKRTGTAA